VLARAGHISVQAASDIIRKYTTGIVQVKHEKVEQATSIKLPGSHKPMELHTRYLTKRGFDVDELMYYHDIRFTGMMEKWEGKDWGLRVIIPVYDRKNRLVSFQGRDCTDRSACRYMFPKKEQQVQDCKTLLYGAELCGGTDKLLVVEGVMDAWKAGRGVVATFGSGVSKEQILEMAHWKTVYLAFDYEPAAQEEASGIAKELSTLGTAAYLVNTDFGLNEDGTVRDIGDLPLADARHFRDSVLG
jgi:DNA primase